MLGKQNACFTKFVSNGSRGIIALTDLVKAQSHVKWLPGKYNHVIPGYSYADDQSYGIHPVYQSLLNPKELKSNSYLNVLSRGGVANMEAMIISFVCEKRLPLALTGILWQFHTLTVTF